MIYEHSASVRNFIRIIMFRFMLLTLLSCVLLLVQAQENLMDKCGRLLHPKGLSCCKKKYIPESIIEELKECMHMPAKPPPSCEREICMAKKGGFGSDDGTLDKTKLKELLKIMTDDKDLQLAIIEDCVNGDLNEYGPPEFCDIMKINTCLHLHLVVDCPDWSNDAHCSGSAEAAEECIKSLP